MTAFSELLLALFLLTDLSLAAASRLKHCIRLVAWQGMMIGLIPLLSWNWRSGFPANSVLLIAAVTLAVKGFLLPRLLERTMYQVGVKRELEPLVGYSFSLILNLVVASAAFYLCHTCRIMPEEAPKLAMPVSFTAIFTGLFIIMARKKAITQAIGFLVFENGITLFGIGMMLEYGWIVEVGILLDVFVLVFVMGIALFHIRREFSHIDSDRLHLLNDTLPEKKEVSEK